MSDEPNTSDEPEPKTDEAEAEAEPGGEGEAQAAPERALELPDPPSQPEPPPVEPVELEPATEPPPTSESSPERPPMNAGYAFLSVVTVVNLAADLLSKWWAKARFENLKPGDPRKYEAIDGVMNFIFAKNRGGAWGLLQNETEALRRPFFLVVSVAAIVFIVSLYRKLQEGQTALKWGLPLVLGGALGNLVDRIRYGYVVDFIDVYVMIDGKTKHWPTFNVADIAICVGVGLMAVDMFTSRTVKRQSKIAPKGDPKPPIVVDESVEPSSQAPPSSASDRPRAET